MQQTSFSFSSSPFSSPLAELQRSPGLHLPEFSEIYVQQAIERYPEWQARAERILKRFPGAEVIPVESHWKIPELRNANPADWIRSKKSALILGIKSGLKHVTNGRSADFIAASMSNGCLSACQYCYVARRKGGSNPLTLFMNIEEIADSIEKHQEKLGPKPEANSCDPKYWTYDIGCNADLSLDALICDHPGYMIERFAKMRFAKATFATKTVNDAYWLAYDPQGRTRIRYSLMPQAIARYVDIRTSPISARIQSVNRLVDAGYEVHLNFSPIIIYGGNQWKSDWLALFQEIDQTLSPQAKAQLACEAFFLSHSAEAHELNLQWNPKGEDFLWKPEMQEPKKNKLDVLVYQYALKHRELSWFKANLAREMPYCPVRYSF
ncbi:MAG: spore photoproduct lyase family protein [Bdellovibrionia bacterium]